MNKPTPRSNLSTFLTRQEPSADSGGQVLKRALHAVRSHLGMDVAYVSEFVDGQSVFREVDAPGCEALIKPGDSRSLDDVYCRHILEGRIPELIPDTRLVPAAAAMPITAAVPIGAHLSVPIRLPNGQPYGMFCCLSFGADPSLNGRDLQMMKVFADLAAFEIHRDLEAGKDADEKRARIRAAIDGEELSTVYQPIYSLETGRPVGLESLARFSAAPVRSPDVWFREAAEVGLGLELEIAAIRKALEALATLPPDIYLALNASAETIVSAPFAGTVRDMPLDRIVLEVTEHASVSDYDQLQSAVFSMRQRGLRLAVDDAGAGYAGLRHMVDLRPDLIKLDLGLVRNINLDPARKALTGALITFARETGSQIIAEGVETASELATLRALGVEMAQGYLLGRPMRLDDALALFEPAFTAARVA